MLKRGAGVAGMALWLVSSGAWAAVADFAADFSASVNPAGPWTYGHAATLGAAPNVSTAMSEYGTGGVIKAWSPAGTFWPTVGLNTSGSAASFGAADVVTLDAGQGLLHPGPQGEFAVVRYTVPTPFLARLDVAFEGVDAANTTTDFHVLKNGVQIFGGLINDYKVRQAFSGTYQFAAGDTVDVFVGWGSNSNYVDDSTGFAMTLAPVPEPGSGVLFLAGLALLGSLAGRRTRR